MKKKILIWVLATVMAASVAMTSGVLVLSAAEKGQWNSTETYTGGDTVTYNGNTYKAKWWNTGEAPGSSQWGAWELVSQEPSETTQTTVTVPSETEVTVPSETEQTEQSGSISDIQDWQAGKTYTDGMLVRYNGIVYKCKWWTNSAPDGSQWGPWEKVEEQGGSETTPSETTPSETTPSETTPSETTPSETTPSETEIPDNPDTTPVKILTDTEIEKYWGGIDPEFSSQNAVNKFSALLSQKDFEDLFPMRHGSEGWNDYNNKNEKEYYTYAGLKEAVEKVANVKYKIETRGGASWNTRIWRLDKTTKEQMLISECVDFNAEWNINKPIDVQVVDFGAFLSEGTETNKKRELAALLANLAHETGGGWATAPGGEFAWGLYYNEEVGYIGSSAVGYVDGTNKDFPPVAGKSYHGRGPIQLSWNYNYGLMSAILFGDKNILLQNPEQVTNDPVTGYMTAIAFWMTPQGNKPSCHEVMAGTWTPTQAQKDAGCTEACFGMTINIINGGYEAGKGMDDHRVYRRAGHYKDITAKMGVDVTGEKLDTLGMKAL